MKKESRFLKYAIIMSLLVGGLSFGLPSVAEDITSGSGLSDANYSSDNRLNILNDIELKQNYYEFPSIRDNILPTIKNSVNIAVNGGGNRVYGTLYSNDHSGFETNGGASLTFNNVRFDQLQYAYSNETGGITSGIEWVMEGAIAHSEYSAGVLTFDTVGFTHNNVSLTAERMNHNVNMQIEGGLVSNNNQSEIKSSNFSENTITSTAITNGGVWSSNDHSLNAQIHGGAVFNSYKEEGSSSQMSISDTIFNATNAKAEVRDNADQVISATATVLGGALYNGNGDLRLSGTTKFTNNTATATGSGNAPLTLTAQGGALYNSGIASISGITFDKNSALAEATGDELTTVTLTAQGGALYNSGTANISGTTFSNNSVTATGGTAQGGAIYNAANAVINISDSTFTGNTANGSANDIYFAQNSTMNVQQGNVTINSGLASDDNTAAINIKSGGNLVVADNNSADYTGSVNIEGYGKLTFASQTAPSLENAIIKVTENYGSVEYKIGSDFTMTENNVTLADGVTNAEIIKSGSNTMTINGDFSDFSGQVSVAEGILKYIADDANDKYYNANSTKVHGGATLIFDIANATGEGGACSKLIRTGFSA